MAYLGTFDNNGSSSMAAVLFDLLGDKDSASFFSGMSLAAVREKEDGHTGPYFSLVWGGLGAACGGDDAATAYMQEMRWYYELMRTPKGDAKYNPVLCGGQEMGAYGKGKYWSLAGAALMHYCAPRHKLFMTGKDKHASPPMTKEQIQECLQVSSRTFAKDPATPELVKMLEHPLPVARRRAAVELGKREDNVVPQMIALLNSPNRYAQYGACEGLRYASKDSKEAADALIAKATTSDDFTLRYFSVLAFAKPKDSHGFDKEARRVGLDILKLGLLDDQKNDPFRKLQATVADVMFYPGGAQGFTGIYPNGKGAEKLDRQVLYPALKSMFTNPNGGARSAAARVYPALAEADIEELAGDMYKAAISKAPSGEMFGPGVKVGTAELFAKHRIKEGLDIIEHLIKHPDHGKNDRNPHVVKLLTSYGTLAKPLVAGIRDTIKGYTPEKQVGKVYFDDLEKVYQSIENSTTTPEVRSIQQLGTLKNSEF